MVAFFAKKNPRPFGRGLLGYPTVINRSWPEVTLQAQDRRPDVLARREVDARRTAARACEVEHRRVRVMLGLDPGVHDFEADIELRSRVPDRPDTGVPHVEVRIAARHRRRTREGDVRSQTIANRALR